MSCVAVPRTSLKVSMWALVRFGPKAWCWNCTLPALTLPIAVWLASGPVAEVTACDMVMAMPVILLSPKTTAPAIIGTASTMLPMVLIEEMVASTIGLAVASVMPVAPLAGR